MSTGDSLLVLSILGATTVLFALLSRQVWLLLSGDFRRIATVSFGLSIAIYVFAVPIELLIRGSRTVGSQHWVMDLGTASRICWAGLSGYAVFLVVVNLAFAVSHPKHVLEKHHTLLVSGARVARRTAFMVFSAATLMLGLLFSEEVAASRDYLSNVAQTSFEGSVGYFLLNRLTYTAYSVGAFLAVLERPSLFRVAVALLPAVGWTIFSNDKDPLTMCGLAVLGAWVLSVSVRGALAKRLVAALSPPLAVVIFGGTNFLLNFLRAPAGPARDYAAAQPLISSGDAGGPAYVLAIVFDGWWAPAGGLHSLWTAVVSPLPTMVRPEARTDLGILFARDFTPNYAPGMGFGFSPLAEAFLMGSILIGLVVVFGVIGLVSGLLVGVAWIVRPRQAPSYAMLFAGSVVVSTFVLFISMRGSLAGFVSTLFYLLLMVAALLFAPRPKMK